MRQLAQLSLIGSNWPSFSLALSHSQPFLWFSLFSQILRKCHYLLYTPHFCCILKWILTFKLGPNTKEMALLHPQTATEEWYDWEDGIYKTWIALICSSWERTNAVLGFTSINIYLHTSCDGPTKWISGAFCGFGLKGSTHSDICWSAKHTAAIQDWGQSSCFMQFMGQSNTIPQWFYLFNFMCNQRQWSLCMSEYLKL